MVVAAEEVVEALITPQPSTTQYVVSTQMEVSYLEGTKTYKQVSDIHKATRSVPHLIRVYGTRQRRL